ncbi:MAG: redoxin family protein [Dehalococcoidia bacterium]|nr:redoxin family protein [Dehalococcoidia bacterium]
MSGVASGAERGQPASPRRGRRHRRRLALAGALVAIAAVAVGIIWYGNRPGGVAPGGMAADTPIQMGKQVQPVSLEDSRSGQMFDLSQDLGKRDVVVVAYMGDFCLGCRELLVALQTRAAEFAAANASLVALGPETGQAGRATAASRGITAYPLLQEGGSRSFTRSIGMWSDMMQMPFMGYVIIGRDGTIMAGEQSSLSEAEGAASSNVDSILAALQAARDRAGGTGATAR